MSWQVEGLRVRSRLRDLSVAALKGQSPNPPGFVPDFLFYFLALRFQTRGLMVIFTWHEALEGNQADLGPIKIYYYENEDQLTVVGFSILLIIKD
jgi:hypothetical protein